MNPWFWLFHVVLAIGTLTAVFAWEVSPWLSILVAVAMVVVEMEVISRKRYWDYVYRD